MYVCVYFLRPWGSGRDIKINSTVEATINKRFQVICNTENMKTCGAIPWLNEVSLWQIEGEGGGGGEYNGAVFGELTECSNKTRTNVWLIEKCNGAVFVDLTVLKLNEK